MKLGFADDIVATYRQSSENCAAEAQAATPREAKKPVEKKAAKAERAEQAEEEAEKDGKTEQAARG